MDAIGGHFSEQLPENDGSTKTTTKKELIDHWRELLTAASSKVSEDFIGKYELAGLRGIADVTRFSYAYVTVFHEREHSTAVLHRTEELLPIVPIGLQFARLLANLFMVPTSNAIIQRRPIGMQEATLCHTEHLQFVRSNCTVDLSARSSSLSSNRNHEHHFTRYTYVHIS